LKIPKGEEFEDTKGRRNSSSPSCIFKLFFSLWYLQTLLLPQVSSNSSSPSGIFKLFFSLWYLQTLLLPLVSSNSSSIPQGEVEFEDTRGSRRVCRYQREKKSLKIPEGEEEFEDNRGRRGG
jgi:hypothetical protein